MFSKRSGSKGKRHFRRRSTRHRRRTHKRKGGMMSAASASKQSASASKQSASKPEEKIIAVWGHWKSKTNHRDYLQGKTFNIATNKTIADLKRAISKHISEKYESGYELPASTKMKPYPHLRDHPQFWVSDDTPIGHLGFDALEINLPPV